MASCSQNIIYVIGVTACGKTSVGKCLRNLLPNSYFLDADDYHSEEAKAAIRSCRPLTDADRVPWLDRVREAAVRLVKEMNNATGSASNVVVACSALKRAYRDRLRATDDGDRVITRFVFLSASREVIERRLRYRKGHFATNVSILDSQFADLQPPADKDAINVNVTDCSAEDAAGEAFQQLVETGKD